MTTRNSIHRLFAFRDLATDNLPAGAIAMLDIPHPFRDVVILVVVASCLMTIRGTAVAEEPAANSDTTEEVFFFIPHTHWEGAVFKTREAYLEMGLPNILRAMAILKAHPNYRFVLDQACYVKPFLERYPEEAAAFRRFVREGRLAIVGGMLVMPDENMPSGESFVRQVMYGKRFFRRALGVDVKIGWQLDAFGHHPQMPQLLKLAGYESLWTQRGMIDPNTPSEFFWDGLDGTRIPTYWLPLSYAITYGSPTEFDKFSEFFRQRFDALAPFTRGRGRVGLAGRDVCLPEPHVPELVTRFNEIDGQPFELRIGVPQDYETIVGQRPNRPTITGDFNPIFQGTYSSRIELKQRTRELERQLTAAEKLGALLQWLGARGGQEILWRAWEPMLFNQAHDLMSGVMTDHVYEDTLRGYDFSQRIAKEELERRLRQVARSIDTKGRGKPVVVWNMLGWERTDAATLRISNTDPNVVGFDLVGPDGQAVPVQLIESVQADNGTLLQADIAFIARDIPALGYSLYRLIPRRQPVDWAAQPSDDSSMENDFYRLNLDIASGAITDLTVKASEWSVLDAPGNVVAQEEDRGDLWELYHNLQSGFVTNKTLHSPPQPDKAVFSSQQSGEDKGTILTGPIYSEFSVAHALGEKNQFATRVRLYRSLPRIDIRTKILNQEKFVRYRVLFPTTIQEGQSYHEIPFGVIARPEKIELPAQNWVDFGNGDHGLAVLNRGLPGNNVGDGTMMLSLLRSTRIQSYGYEGGYERGMSSDSGFQLGREFTFDYALVPHEGNWRQARVYRQGWEFNHPLIAQTVPSHEGQLPNRWGLLQVTPDNVIVSALKPGRSGTSVLRIYETAGKSTDVEISLSVDASAATIVNLLEDDQDETVDIVDRCLKVNLHPFEIKTVQLQLEPRQE
jgi:alpha-mannosidase